MRIPYSRLEETLKRSYTSLDNPGFCLACGYEQDGCEPDAEYYECEECGKHKVFGAEQILLMGYYDSTK